MNHDMHDDGLVHSHNWAKEPPPAVGELLRPMGEAGSRQGVPGEAPARPGTHS